MEILVHVVGCGHELIKNVQSMQLQIMFNISVKSKQCNKTSPIPGVLGMLADVHVIRV